MDRPLLQKLSEVIEANLGNRSFGAKELARIMGISHSSLFRKVRSLTGKSISKLITEIRMNKSLEMLQADDTAIFEVAHKLGFRSQASFSTSFRNHFGFPPREAKNRGGDKGEEVQKVKEVKGGDRKGSAVSVMEGRNRAGMVWWVVGSAGVLVLAAALIFLGSTGKTREKVSIAVLPFRDLTQDAQGATLSEILWEEVITTLSQIKVFDVRSAVSSGLYRDPDKSITEIGKELKADYIIEGSMEKEGNQVKLWIQLIRATTDDHFWAEDYLFTMNELTERMVDLAEHTAYQLNMRLEPGERSAILLKCSENNEAIMNHIQGNFWLNSNTGDNSERALACFRKAIELDSSWPGPYNGLARALQMMIRKEPKEEYIRERLRAVEKSHQLKPTAWSFQALAQFYLDAGDYKKSRLFYTEGIRKFPEDANLNYIIARSCQKTGKWKEAEKRYIIFNKLVPLSPSGYHAVGRTYEMVRDFPKAVQYLNQGIAVNPNWSFSYFNLADISLKWKGDPDEARNILENAMNKSQWEPLNILHARSKFILADIYEGNFEAALKELSLWIDGVPYDPPYYFHPKYLYLARVYGLMNNPYLERIYFDSTRTYIEDLIEEFPGMLKRPCFISCLGVAYAGLGDTLKAIDMVKGVKRLLKETPDAFYGPFAMEDVAWIYTKTGDHSKALQTIRTLLSKPGPLTAKLLEIDPKWAPLKEFPGYKRLIDRYSIDIVQVPESGSETMDLKPKKPEITGPTFTDERDGTIYHYKQIGTQVWMTDNIAYLPAVSPPDTGSYTEKHYYVWGFQGTRVAEAKETENYAVYGVLYNWEASMTACPPGWHLPSDEEWKILEINLGMSKSHADATGHRESGSVGKKLKFTAGWQNKGIGDNSGGFYALPAGGRYFGNLFYELGIVTDFWSSTEVDDSHALFRDLRNEFEGVYRYFFDKRNGFSVRCVRD